MANPNDDISLKGLDNFSKSFLASGVTPGETEYIKVGQGQTISDDALARYAEERKKEFIRRAGNFTEDLIAFFAQQQKIRNLTHYEAAFALALTTIQLRNSYAGRNVKLGQKPTEELTAANLEEFDNICAYAQEFFDANKE